MVRIVTPNIEVITNIENDRILKHIESCGRTCYQSYENTTDDTSSAEKMIRMLIKSGHESVLEHISLTVKLTTDVGAYKDLTRHRAGTAFSIESTRFCNYSKGKFGNEISVIKPCNIQEGSDEYNIWLETMNNIEKSYNKMAELGCKPDQLRMILPHSTAAEVSMTGNLRSWRHIFKMRCAKQSHPSVREIMLLTLYNFHSRLSVIFDDLYDEYKEDIENAIKNCSITI